MNTLSTEKKTLAVSMRCEGSSIRAVERVTGVHRDTIMRLGVRIGEACAKIQDEKFRNLNCANVEVVKPEDFITILELPPVDSAQAAVKLGVGIAHQVKKANK